MPLDTSKPEFKRYRTGDHGQNAPVLGRDGDDKIKYLTTSSDPEHEHDDSSSTVYILVTCAVRAENYEPTEVLISPVYTLRRQKGLLQHCLSPSASATLHAAILQLHNPVASGPEEIRGSGWLVRMIRASYNVRELECAPARMMLEEC
ncbi:hypothetical protein EXIGLDRAFT_761311 [Exidia glandulosa HHB12029]|uniref:Uncharacterized protein n=1 Tax=Exidia glandulosa HHB12029 TaxID=1314781 RepID=A0A165NHG4_EXIGL|nr:hypothetical protein EXIGLDRAFT_761311 [Exidia glandulosa HHB12029]